VVVEVWWEERQVGETKVEPFKRAATTTILNVQATSKFCSINMNAVGDQGSGKEEPKRTLQKNT
jgi:hypothetical protein